ncbi:hypothetical protein EN858_01070 [Mesorhizobium sp. M4B.F.Ca.ET.215.01.1.1]|uniref:hypothetical protein n=1 Tax=unclassified Mesorhizobium TaxID=325217 RepID=UPI000FCC6FDF|nr:MULTISPECIES: hypothetical protein [unclassified Mesorhizobium]RUW28058.1 hypothetical protein EOA34_02230 [Mesorhizobium sp. M4B.F.Ca.ET.013.02.1.1]RUW72958.1 hypothetical protein EOA31_14260 [Mesorhizobium sp. M4B.F.Ca.ET.049.02.1.2]RVD43185.1 hypothetical protein EN741_10415 [Mesorhizobium sp. M4B.F.Ca.ET.019.03.1.1]RWF67721.1 MAG: hypothetical protein EOS47_00250 [Mesorhizobium sp.]RWX59423.1 hypothetical protein EN780_34495 [Mesorhizobium sp. M4B.F.Ca.ET.089.01.1.1]
MGADRFCQSLGLCLIGLGTVFLLFVAAYPLGLVQAYPTPPVEAIEGPLGFEKKIGDLNGLYRGPNEPRQVYLERLTKAVAGGVVHYWTEGDRWTDTDARYTKISVFDNYVIWLLGWLPAYHDSFQNYEFLTPRKALDRGYGFCSQVSKIVYSILTEQGIPATIYSAEQHTIVEVDGNVLDSDYGVLVPYPLALVEKDPSIVDSYYSDYEDMLPLLHGAYGQPWHRLGTPEGFQSARSYETILERLKWLPPVILLLIGVLLATGGLLGRGPFVSAPKIFAFGRSPNRGA